MAAEVFQSTIVALFLGVASVVLLRAIIPHLYQQDRRLAQFIYLDFFWIATFFVIYLYEQSSISTIGFSLGADPLETLVFTILSVLVTLFLFIISARREKQRGVISVEKGFLKVGPEHVDLRMISLLGFVQTFLMQIIWVALPLEIFFRGYLVTRFAQSFPEFGAIIIAAIIYFVAYLDRPIFGTINILLALVWGYSLIATGSILPGLVAHIFINTTSFYFARNIALSSRV